MQKPITDTAADVVGGGQVVGRLGQVLQDHVVVELGRPGQAGVEVERARRR